MYEFDKRIFVITVVAIGALAGLQLLFVPPAVAQSAQPRFLNRALPAETRAAVVYYTSRLPGDRW